MNKILIAFLSGVVIGVLVAPAKGADTRKQLADKLDRIKDIPERNKKKEMYKNALDTIGEQIGV